MIRSLLILVVFSLFSFSVHASEPLVKVENKSWGFLGPFGTYNKSSLQRGLQVYTEVCSSCHSLKYIAYRNLSDLGYDKEEIKAFSANFLVKDGPNDDGEMFERPARPADRFVNPYLNDNEARANNNGAYPPDLSVITKARRYGEDYIYNLLMGYEEPPEGMEVGNGMYYNKWMDGNQIAMPVPILDDSVDYDDGTETNAKQLSEDVVTFLKWAAEPELEERKNLGIKVILFFLILGTVVYLAKNRLWREVH